MNHSDNQNDDKEKALREQIRKRLLEQSTRITEELKELEARESRILEARRVQAIVEEEREKFYVNLGYVKVVDEDGAAEWLPPDRAKALEDKIGEEIDDLEGGQRKVRWFGVIWVTLSLAMVGILIFIFWPKPGSIRVATNIRGANVVFNNDTTLMMTDTTITGIGAGKQIISVSKKGYRVKGNKYQLLNLQRGENAVTFFELELVPPESTEAAPEKTETPLITDTLYERIKRKEMERLIPNKLDSISVLDTMKH